MCECEGGVASEYGCKSGILSCGMCVCVCVCEDVVEGNDFRRETASLIAVGEQRLRIFVAIRFWADRRRGVVNMVHSSRETMGS